jgi:predicted permease
MPMLREWLRRFWGTLRRNPRDRDLEEELASHLEMVADEARRRGESPERAVRAARIEAGGVAQAMEALRDQRGLPWLDDLARDVRYGARTLANAPGYAAVSVATLALGIGATTVLFTAVEEVLLRGLPVERPEELIELGCINPLDPSSEGQCGASVAGFDMYRADRGTIAGAFAFAPVDMAMSRSGAPEIVRGMLTSGDTYSVLGLAPHLGRLLTPADDRPGAPLVAVVSHAFWQRQFGANAAIVGQTMRLNQQPATIVGVTPPEFRGLTLGDVPEVTVPLSTADLFLGRGTLDNRGSWWLRVIVRRRPDVSMSRVQVTLEPVFERAVDDMLASVPPQVARGVREFASRLRFDVRPARMGATSGFRDSLDRPLRILMGTVVGFLLIACANLAGLVASRTMSRRREFGLRLALGATRARLVRQVVTENLLVAAIGGVLGVILAQWAGPAFVRLLAGDAGLLALGLRPDGSIVALAAAASIIAGVLAGTGAVVRTARSDPHDALKAIKGQARLSLSGRALVAGQCAVTVMLLVGATLFLQTLANYRSVDPGFAIDGRVVASVDPGLAGYDNDRLRVYLDAVVDRLQAVPGVQSASFSGSSLGSLENTTLVEAPGFESGPAEQRVTGRNPVGPNFADTAGLRLLYGRDIAATDTAASERAALVNETFARHFFGTANAVGRQFRTVGQPTQSIVGVVADARDRGVKTPSERMVYEAFWQNPDSTPTITVLAAPGLANVLPAVERAIQASDPAVPIRGLRMLADDFDEALRQERVLSQLAVVFAASALLLVAIGLYGTLSGVVVRRTVEIGIRMALGSTRGRVVWVVTRGTLAVVASGLVLGLVGAAGLTRFIQSQLYDVSPLDPVVLAAPVAVLLAGTLCAVAIPAHRASRVDPAVALRED